MGSNSQRLFQGFGFVPVKKRSERQNDFDSRCAKIYAIMCSVTSYSPDADGAKNEEIFRDIIMALLDRNTELWAITCGLAISTMDTDFKKDRINELTMQLLQCHGTPPIPGNPLETPRVPPIYLHICFSQMASAGMMITKQEVKQLSDFYEGKVHPVDKAMHSQLLSRGL